MTYEQIIALLISNHFYPKRIVKIYKSHEEITGLEIVAPPIRASEIKKRIEEIFAVAGIEASVDEMPNFGVVLIRKK